MTHNHAQLAGEVEVARGIGGMAKRGGGTNRGGGNPIQIEGGQGRCYFFTGIFFIFSHLRNL